MDPRASRALARRREIVLCDDEGQDSSLHTFKAAMRWLLAASVVAGATLATVTASAQASTAACIEDKTKQSFTCSGVGPRELDASQRRTGVDLHAVQPPARASAPARPPAPTAVE
jgi:hypothetical protein